MDSWKSCCSLWRAAGISGMHPWITTGQPLNRFRTQPPPPHPQIFTANNSWQNAPLRSPWWWRVTGFCIFHFPFLHRELIEMTILLVTWCRQVSDQWRGELDEKKVREDPFSSLGRYYKHLMRDSRILTAAGNGSCPRLPENVQRWVGEMAQCLRVLVARERESKWRDSSWGCASGANNDCCASTGSWVQISSTQVNIWAWPPLFL